MADLRQEPPPNPGSAPAPKGRGCFFWGCLTVLIVGLLVLGLVALGTYRIISMAKEYTSEEAAAIPVHRPGPGEYEGLQQRIRAFEGAADGTGRLELSEADLNTLLVGGEGRNAAQGKCYVRIDGDRLALDVSVPVEEIPFVGELPGLKGRHFNGRVEVTLAVAAGRPVAYLLDASVGDKSLPEAFLKAVAQKDLFEDMRRKGTMPAVLEKAKTLEVKDGKVTLTR